MSTLYQILWKKKQLYIFFLKYENVIKLDAAGTHYIESS